MSEPRWLDETQKVAWMGLLAVVNRAFPEFERTLKQHDLLAVQFQVLVTLSAAPEQTLQLSQLADLANISQSRLTHRLRLLVERGDVVVTEDPDDGRAKRATLTQEGQRRLDVVAPFHVEDVQRLIFDPLTASETKALANALDKIAAALCCHPEYLNPR
ncbi:MAG: MarR family transcriptional regulator [Actinomycetota bacterium]